MQFLFAPAYGSREWYAWSRQNGPVQCFCAAQKGQMDSRFDSVVQVDSPLRTSIGEVLCNHADLLLLTWNEDVTELDCATWELLRMALQKKVPCIWISSQTGKEYWLGNNFYVPFRQEQFDHLVELSRLAMIEPMACPKKQSLTCTVVLYNLAISVQVRLYFQTYRCYSTNYHRHLY